MTIEDSAIHIPSEQLPITLFDAVVLAVRAEDGTISLAIRDVCQALAIDVSTQLRRIRTHSVLSEGVARFRVMTAGGMQPQEFLEQELIPTWLLMINAARVSDAVRPRLLWLQRYIVREVYRALYADCVAFIQQSYRSLTGEELDLPEQGALDLGDV
jgi:hypothetical protein